MDSKLRRAPAHSTFKKLCFVTVILFVLYQLHNSHTVSRRYISLLSDSDPACKPIALPPTRRSVRIVKDTWTRLQDLFDSHRPQPDLGRGTFPGGELVEITVDLLNDFLPITASEAAEVRSMHADLVKRLPDYPMNAYEGRGVVMVAGGKHSEYVTTSLGMLRLVGSKLPVEVWMLDQSEEKEGWCAELAEEGVTCRHLSDFVNPSTSFKHPFQYKLAAMFFSSFQEVLYLDSDSIPVINPDAVFDSKAFQETGAVLWPDYWRSTESPWTSYITGASDRQSEEIPKKRTVDSGQMLWDKKRQWKALCLCAYYNQHGPNYFYSLITQGGPGWGDKDTFPTALRAASAPWTLVPHNIFIIYYNDGNDSPKGTGMSMMQADPSDEDHRRPLFLHSNFVKASVRRLMCDECVEEEYALTPAQRGTGERVTFLGSVNNTNSPIYSNLNLGQRIYAIKGKSGMAVTGVDPEPDMWRVMERVACVGVWSEPGLCARTRIHLKETFGLIGGWRGNTGHRCDKLKTKRWM